MEELGEHFATEEGGEEVVFVALDDGRAFVPKVIAVEEDMVDGVLVAAVRACGVVPSVLLEVGGVGGIEGVSYDKLECC